MRRVSQRVRDEIFRHWLMGDSYRKIARDNNVSISTVHVIKEECKKNWPDIEELRRVTILIKKSGINFYDMLRGLTLLEELNSCGVSLADLDNFVKLIETLFSGNNRRKEEIIDASIRLIDLEEKAGKSYPEVVKDFQKKNSKIPKLETKIDHLKVEEYAKRAQVSKLKRSAEALRSENQELYSQKNRVLGDIAAFRNVHSVLMKGILYVPCKHCGWPYIKLKMPSKQEYLHMIRNCEGYMVLCQNCHKISFFHSQEIVAGIGWALLPEDVVISTNA